MAAGWKLMFPLSPVTPLFVMSRQVEHDALFQTIRASGVLLGAQDNLSSAELQWDPCYSWHM